MGAREDDGSASRSIAGGMEGGAETVETAEHHQPQQATAEGEQEAGESAAAPAQDAIPDMTPSVATQPSMQQVE